MPSFSTRSLAVVLIRISLALYLGAAGIALLAGQASPAADPKEAIWIPMHAAGSAASLTGAVLLVCGSLLLAGIATEVVSLASAALLLAALAAWLVTNALHNTMNHLIPFTAAALIVFAGASYDRLRLFARPPRFDDTTRVSFVVLATRLFLGGIFLAQGLRSIRRLGLVGFAEKVYVAPLAGSWMPEPLLWIAGVTNPIIQITTGSLLLAGLFTRTAVSAAALFLVSIFFGHLLSDPFDRGDSVHAYAMANFLLAMVILWLHPRGDRFSLDALMQRRRASGTAAIALLLMLAGCASTPALERELAAVDAHIASQRFQHVPRRDAERRARAALDAAKRIAPDDARVLAATAQIALIYDFDEEGAAKRYERASSLRPNDPELLFDRAQVLGGLGRFGEAVALLDRAIALDPRVRERAGRLLYMAGEYDRVFASYVPMPDQPRAQAIAHFYRGLTLEQLHRAAESLPEHERAAELLDGDAGAVAALARTYALNGRRDDALRLIAELEARRAARRHVVEYQLAAAYEALGDDEAALTWLRNAVDARDPWLMWLNVDPRWKRLRALPDFAALPNASR